MRASQTRNRSRKSRGSILIGVLVILFLMSIVILKFITEATREIEYQSQFQGQEDLRSQAYCVFDAALATLHEIREIDGQLYRPVQGWGDPLGYSNIPLPEGIKSEVKITDESGKLPINHNNVQIWNLLFEEMGIDLSDAEILTDSLIDWMDQDDLKRLNGAEKDDYELDSKEYKPSNEMLKDFDELRLIQGFDEQFFNEEDGTPNQFFQSFKQSVSLHNQHPVNVNAAQGLVLNVLARLGGFDGEYLQQHLRGPDNLTGTGDDPWLTNMNQIPGFGAGLTAGGGAPPSNLFGATSQMFRVEVKVSRGASIFLMDTLVGPKGSAAQARTQNASRGQTPSSRVRKPTSSRSTGNKSSSGGSGYYPFDVIHISENRIF
jgi:hypothetical protein